MDIIPEVSFSIWIEAGIYAATLIVAYVFGGLKEFKKWSQKKQKGNIDWSVHSDIHEFLTELRVKTHASRAQVIQFHNGEYFMDGISMQKMSTTHESLNVGISSDHLSGSLITLYSSLMKQLESTLKQYFVQEEDASYFNNTLELSNVNSYMVIPFFHNGSKSGCLILHWCGEKINDYVVDNIAKVKDDVHYTRTIIQLKLNNQIKGSK